MNFGNMRTVFNMPACIPFSHVDGAGAKLPEACGGCTVRVFVSCCVGLRGYSVVDVVLSGVPFHFATCNRVGAFSDNASQEHEREVAVLLHFPRSPQWPVTMSFLESSD